MGDAQTFAGEISACGLLDVFWGHALQVGKLGVHEFPGQADGFQGADGRGLAGDGITLVHQAGNHLGTDALQFFGGRRLGLQLIEQAPQAGFGLGDGFLLLLVRRGRERKQAVATGVGVVVGGSRGHQLFTAFQLLGDPCTVAAVQQGRDQAQGLHRTFVFSGGQAGHVEAQEHARQLGLHVQG